MSPVTDEQLIAEYRKTENASQAGRNLGIAPRTARERIQSLTLDGRNPIPLAKVNGKAPPQVLLYDVETAPHLAYVWGMFKQTLGPNQILETTDVMCWAAKWLGQDAVLSESRVDDDSDERISRELWTLFDQADFVIGHNSRGFDDKIMRARWVKYGMPPPSPFKSVDTLTIAKSFRFPRNKLESLARYFDIGHKVEHEGFDLWVKCLRGDKDAWNRMAEYNIHDVVLLEQVYIKLRAWDNRAPNISLYYHDDLTRCVVCGSSSLTDIPQSAYTGVSEFPACRCRSCGKVMRTGSRYRADKTVLRNVL